jgi:acetylornithine aminotransferase
LEFDFEIAPLRKKLLDKKHIFTGNSNNKNLIRILPPLTIQKHHFDVFFEGLIEILNTND